MTHIRLIIEEGGDTAEILFEFDKELPLQEDAKELLVEFCRQFANKCEEFC